MSDVKTIWVQAHFKEFGTWSTKTTQVGVDESLVEKGIFRKRVVVEKIPIVKDEKIWTAVGVSDKAIDGERLSRDIQDAVAMLVDDGYRISSIVPVLSGQYDCSSGAGPSYGWGYGFSFTEGVTVVGVKAAIRSDA